MSSKPKYIKEALKIAKQFDYETWLPGILKRIENAQSETQVTNILISGRHAMFEN